MTRSSKCCLWAAAIVFIFAVACFGQMNETPNTIGIYFDEGATTNEHYTGVPGTVYAYLVLTHPTMTFIDHWWGGVVGDAPVTAEIRGNGVNLEPPSGDIFVVFFNVEYSVPLQTNTATILADLTYELDSEEIARFLYVAEYFGDADLELFRVSYEGEAFLLEASTGCPNGMPPCWPAWAATINGLGPVAAESATWGEVKRLYYRH